MPALEGAFHQAKPRLVEMRLTCMMIATSGEKRRLSAPATLNGLELQRLCVVMTLAARFLRDDTGANGAAASLIPARRANAEQELRGALAWDFSPASFFDPRSPSPSEWFDLAGDVSTTAPGLFHLFQAASRLPQEFSWSPGQVSDVLQSVLHLRPILAQHGLATSSGAATAFDKFHAFLSLAHSNDGYILGRGE